MISVVILTKDSEKSLKDTLLSTEFLDEVIILDTGSSDGTKALALTFPNVKLYSSPFLGFGQLRNLGASYASNDWILALDSDEIISPKLQEEILSLPKDPYTIYDIPFINFYKGKQVKCCGWYPESHIRLYNKKSSSFEESYVHEGIRTKDLQIKRLQHPIYHTPYRSIDDFLTKMQRYSSLFAMQNKKIKRGSFSKAFFHASFTFFKNYFFQKGIFYGSRGFIIATYNASTTFYKYLKLEESQR